MPNQTPSLRGALDFLNDLSQFNNKVWFDAHRADYEAARASFAALVEVVIEARRGPDALQGLTAKDCLMRINRDIRFSKDKSPYRTSFGATIAPGGKKSAKLGYHISVAPHGNTIVAGGLYMPMPAQLAAFRRAVADDASDFKRITKAKAFVTYFGQIEGESLSTAPQGYSRTHPAIALLKLKQVVVVRHYSDNVVISKGFGKDVIDACKAMRPFLDYLNGLE